MSLPDYKSTEKPPSSAAPVRLQPSVRSFGSLVELKEILHLLGGWTGGCRCSQTTNYNFFQSETGQMFAVLLFHGILISTVFQRRVKGRSDSQESNFQLRGSFVSNVPKTFPTVLGLMGTPFNFSVHVKVEPMQWAVGFHRFTEVLLYFQFSRICSTLLEEQGKRCHSLAATVGSFTGKWGADTKQCTVTATARS